MKNLITSTMVLGAILFSCSAFADKIIIKGEPVTIEKRGNVYFVPDSYQATTEYYYVSTEGTQRICYKEKQPALNIEAFPLDVQLAGKPYTWSCYNYDPTYFQLQP
jgi:hypothetical protein